VTKPYAMLPVLLVVMILGTAGAGMLGWRYLENSMVGMVGESLSLLSAEIADKLDQFMLERQGDIHMIVRALIQQPANIPYMTTSMQSLQRDSTLYHWLGVADMHGRIVASTDPASLGKDVSLTVGLQVAAEPGVVSVLDIRPSISGDGVEGIVFTAPFEDPNGRLHGVVVAQVALAALEQLTTQAISRVEFREAAMGLIEYQVLTRSGRAFIDSYAGGMKHVNLKEMQLPSALLSESGQSGFIEETHLRSHLRVITGYARTRGYGNFDGLGWTVLVRLERTRMLAPARAVTSRLMLAGAAVFTPLFGFLLWTTRRVRLESARAQDESQQARMSERRLKAMLEASPECAVMVDSQGTVCDINPAGLTLFGAQSRDEVVRKPKLLCIDPCDHQAFQRFQSVTSRDDVQSQQVRTRGVHGGQRWAEVTAVPLRGESDDIGLLLIVLRDITARRQQETHKTAEHRVTHVLAETPSLLEAAPLLLEAICISLDWVVGVLWVVDHDTNALRCVAIWRQATDRLNIFVTSSQRMSFTAGVGLPGRVWARREPVWIPDVVSDANFPRAAVAAQAGLHAAFGFPIELEGEMLAILEFFSPEIQEPDHDLLSTMGTIGSQIGLFIKRRRAEETLRESEARTRSIIDTALDAVITMDVQGRITEWNTRAEKLFGWPRDEAVGRILSSTIIPPRYWEAHERGVKHYVETGDGPVLNRVVEIEARHREGHEFPVELAIVPLRLGGRWSSAHSSGTSRSASKPKPRCAR
jgi:two-component system, cell cycle sensor histidine kinase and response regulator CckA